MNFPAVRILSAVAFIAAVTPQRPSRADEGVSPDEVVAAFEKLSGVHKGLRRNHTKGACALGRFEPTADARALSASALFAGPAVPVVARFSVAGPNPAGSDAAKSPRGMALQFALPGGVTHNMALLNIPVFGAATVQSFYESLLANEPDPATGKPDPEKFKAYLATHPDSKALGTWFATHNPPPSYTETAYFSLHAFKFVAADNSEHWVKWRFAPRDGEKFLTDAEMAASPKDFLAQGLVERLAKGPAQWDMIVISGEKGDPIDNPSLTWPSDRREVKAGVLTITQAGPEAAGRCDDINYDPNLVSAGVETSPDPILLFRSGAYAVSVGKRLEEKAQ